MYTISNANRQEIISLLRVIIGTKGIDAKSVNRRRKAALLIKKLNKDKEQLSMERRGY